MNTLPKKTDIKIDDEIEVGNFATYKHHPGKHVPKFIDLPEELEKTINKIISGSFYSQPVLFHLCQFLIRLYNIVSGNSLPNLIENAKKLQITLHERRRPLEHRERISIKEELALKHDLLVNGKTLFYLSF